MWAAELELNPGLGLRWDIIELIRNFSSSFFTQAGYTEYVLVAGNTGTDHSTSFNLMAASDRPQLNIEPGIWRGALETGSLGNTGSGAIPGQLTTYLDVSLQPHLDSVPESTYIHTLSGRDRWSSRSSTLRCELLAPWLDWPNGCGNIHKSPFPSGFDP